MSQGGTLIHNLQATYGELEINARAWEVRLGGAVIDLTRTEFEILALLASQPREVVPDEEITRQIWGDGWFGDDNNLAVHVSKLRHKLGESGSQPRYIRTVRGVGYRFEPGARHHQAADIPEPACEVLRRDPGAVDVLTDGRLRVVSVHPADTPVLGFAPGHLLGRYFGVIEQHPWDDHQSALGGIAVLISSGVREWTASHVVRRSDGSQVHADFATCLSVDDEGRLRQLHFVVVERGRNLEAADSCAKSRGRGSLIAGQRAAARLA
jgi:DNA-binding winged helix-turn-helix (wHTH) protein